MRRFYSLLLVLQIPAILCAAPPATRYSSADPATARAVLAMNYCVPELHLELAQSLRDRGSIVRAFLICEDARARFGDVAFDKAFDRVFLGKTTVLGHARQQVLMRASRMDPHNASLLHELGQLYLLDGKDKAAARVLQLALLESPTDATILQDLVQAMKTGGRQSEADAMFAQWCDQHPDSVFTCRLQIDRCLQTDPQSTETVLNDALKRFPQEGSFHLLRAQCLHNQQRDDEAEAEFRASASLSPKSAEAQIATAHFFLTVREDGARALPFYLTAYFLDPRSGDWISTADHIRNLRSNVEMDAMSVDQLWNAAADEVPEVAEEASERLAAMSDPSPLTLLKDPDPWKRAAAATVLIDRGCTLDQIAPLLSDPVSMVRYRCAIALLMTGNRDAVSAHLRDREPDSAMRDELNLALDAIK